jgi:hypothetical protein
MPSEIAKLLYCFKKIIENSKKIIEKFKLLGKLYKYYSLQTFAAFQVNGKT